MSTSDVVLMTGVTGTLGAAFAARVRREGVKVAAAVRRDWQVERVRAVLGNDGVLVGVVGSQDGEAAAGFVKGANDALGPITAVVSTAGLFRSAEVGREPAGELALLLEANLSSGANLVRAALPGMRRRQRGTITFVGSDAVGRDVVRSPNYLASKAAVHEYVRALALALRGTGVRASAIVPGTLDTPDNRAAMPEADRSTWIPIERAVDALIACAFGPNGDGGPLYPLRASD